jgi:mannose-6-phosphate isomerase-like protein (cupin superfamily)
VADVVASRGRLRPRDAVAPDGLDVWLLERTDGVSSALFQANSRQVGRAVRHRTVEEIWYCLSGRAEMWLLSPDGSERTVALARGSCVSIPVGTTFQLRNLARRNASFFGVTVPAWPGEGEAELVPGRWPTTAGSRSQAAMSYESTSARPSDSDEPADKTGGSE